ncbi:MAG: hypothetical protein A2176_08460 [Spirochaetes bacterium RBG_13_51_14]|nr:MAG: hypothetical protein A2176_08460 [Spirochaetes bacterium RBG_13_51_14]
MAKKSAGSKSSNRLRTSTEKKSTGMKKRPAKPKKQAKRKTSRKDKTLRDQLIGQVSALTATLDEESLKSLVQDAAILAHNERVLKDFAERKKRSGPPPPVVRAAIEEDTAGTYFIITLNGFRNFFAREEMRRLVNLCHGAESGAGAATRLYSWFERERLDVLKNSKIAGHADPSLPALWEMVVSTYKTKG